MQHFDPNSKTTQPVKTRRTRGRRAYLSGVAAETSVTRRYVDRDAQILENRWRGSGGEIDLICLQDDVIVFVEVKKAQSFERALNSLSAAQIQRIHQTASEYLAHTPKGQLSDVRFDLALVDETGQVRVMENAFGHF